MYREKDIERAFLVEILNILKENKALTQKEANIIWNYAIQTKDSKKIINDSKFSKIISKMEKSKLPIYEKNPSSLYITIKNKLPYSGSFDSTHIKRMFDLSEGSIANVICSLTKAIQSKQQTLEKKKANVDMNRNESLHVYTKNKISKKESQSVYDTNETNRNRVHETSYIEQKSLDSETVTEKIKQEEKIYNKSLRSKEYPKDFKYEGSNSEEKERISYLNDNLKIEWRLNNQHQFDILHNIRNMMRDSKKIQELLEMHLKKTSIPSANNSELAKMTYNKYDPYKLLLKYGEQYNKIKKQMDNMSEEQKKQIQEYFEKMNVEFIPSQQDILDRANENMQEFILEHGYGMEDQQKHIVVGLTRYMSEQQLSGIYYKMKESIKRIYGDIDYGENKELINDKPGLKKIKNVQESICMSIANVRSRDKKKRMTKTEICEQILEEQPLFRETRISPEQIAELDKETALTSSEEGFWRKLIAKIKNRSKENREISNKTKDDN